MSKERNLIEMLRLEVAKKGQPASYALLAFSLFSFFYNYGCTILLPYIKAIALVLFVLALIRFWLYQKIIKNNTITQKEWILAVILITLNGLGIATILTLASFELKLTGVHYITVVSLIAGFLASSIITLANFPILFMPFQFFFLLPQVILIIYFYFSPDHINLLHLIFLYAMFYLYQLKQFRTYRNELIQHFTYQIELERKNQELKQSKDLIVEQTVQLVHTSRLALLGEMSAGVAHEINNPLSVISSSVQMLQRLVKTDTLDLKIVNDYTTKATKAIHRISAIVNGLKHLSNQSERLPKAKVTAEEILQETTPFVQEHFIAMGINFKVTVTEGIQLACHPVQISQVLINILKNAADALNECRAEDKWIHLNVYKNQNFLRLAISNGGPKINPDLVKSLFTPFVTTKKNGTGLGLSISQAIMKEHGGEIYLDLKAPYTTFVIQHPLA